MSSRIQPAPFARRRLLGATALSAGLWAAAAHAQVTAPPQPAAANANEVVVTATRVQRAGYTAPTPTTVVSGADIKAAAPANISDYLNELPALSDSQTPRSSQPGGGPTAGMNLLNLRGLGPNRTLVLLDGRRPTPSTVSGNIDINTLPTALVQRVDIVTGGASADYGSDAVAGVVNFILDTKFNGFAANAQGGATDLGDGAEYRLELAGGRSLFDGRAHVEASATYNVVGDAGEAGSRAWFRGAKLFNNPTPGATPARYVVSGVGLSQATDGGLITGGPLKGVQFGPGGVPMPFNFGTTSGLLSYGGDAIDYASRIQLQAPTAQFTAFSRASYDITPDITAYGEFRYAHTGSESESVSYNQFGTITIRRDNAYLDPSIAARMAALNLASFPLGRTNYDFGPVVYKTDSDVYDFLGGFTGKLFKTYTWDAYVQHGSNDSTTLGLNDTLTPNYALAADAVKAPNGQIVCRLTLTNPSNGCVPVNLFGAGSPSAAARAYILSTAHRPIKTTQDEAAVNLQGEPFSVWAGPVSIATGFEYRRETYKAGSDPDDIANHFWLGNFQPSRGHFDVKEGFFETVVPIVRDLPFFKAVDFNGAVRETSYSESGEVTTWKLGVTWDVTRDLRLRATRSRDIRAPNLNDLFQGGVTTLSTLNDPVLNQSYQVQVVQAGNLNLTPEIADTTSGGAVFRPRWLHGFTASIDYFDIDIEQAIVTVPAQTLLNQCVAGVTELCDLITRNAAGKIVTVQVSGSNVQSEKVSGLDFEASYTTDLARWSPALRGRLDLRALGTHVFSRTVNAVGTLTDYAGTLSDATAEPDWRWYATATYTLGPLSTQLTLRYIGDGELTTLAPAIAGNSVASVTYANLGATYRLRSGVQVFAQIDNLLDADPPAAVATLGAVQTQTGTNPLLYDTIGRQYRVGARLRF